MIEPGARCVINSSGDLYMDYDARPFIDQPCEVVKITKAGLVMVRLLADPKKVMSFAKRNVDVTN